MERTLTSQEETNRAMRESLDAYKQIVDRYAAMHERTARLVQTAVDDLTSAGQGQMDAAKAMLMPQTAASTAATAASEPFTQMMQTWIDAFPRLAAAIQGIPDRPDLGDGSSR